MSTGAKLNGWYTFYQGECDYSLVMYARGLTAYEAREEAARVMGVAPQDLTIRWLGYFFPV